MLGLSGHITVFTMIKLVFGSSMAWCAPIVMAPLLLVDGFIVDLKAFIAPTMANALKIREQIRVPRHHFHLAIWAAIVVTTLVSVVTLIILSYQHGADNLQEWLNTATPKWAFGGVKGVIESSGVVKASDRGWLLGGAALMGLLLFSRRRVFGVPHPIGLLMLMNPNMFGFWASIMIGGTIKSLVSKYCTQEQYIAIRRFFIGLVLGHLAAVLFGWQSLNFHWG